MVPIPSGFGVRIASGRMDRHAKPGSYSSREREAGSARQRSLHLRDPLRRRLYGQSQLYLAECQLRQIREVATARLEDARSLPWLASKRTIAAKVAEVLVLGSTYVPRLR